MTENHELPAMAIDPELSAPRREAARWALGEIDALQARAERAEAAVSEAQRRRDAWKAKAKGADAMEAALRAHVGNPGPPSLSRLLWAGLSAAETRRADRAVAALATARDDGIEAARDLIQRVADGYAAGGDGAIACALYLTAGNVQAMKGGDV